MRDSMIGAIGVEKMCGAWKQLLPEGPLLVIQSGMDDLTVTGRGVFADALLSLQQQDFAPCDCQGARYGEADNARTDHDTVCCLHERSPHSGNPAAPISQLPRLSGDPTDRPLPANPWP